MIPTQRWIHSTDMAELELARTEQFRSCIVYSEPMIQPVENDGAYCR
jgi:hypothetical protein